jgi:hypothetical protein
MINAALAEPPSCAQCTTPMKEIRAWERPPSPKHLAQGTRLSGRISSFFESPLGLALFVGLSLAPALSLSLDPGWRWFAIAHLVPTVLIPLILGGFVLGSIVASLREIAELIRDRRTRIIHGIEHATVVMLLRRGFQVIGGQTDTGYFKLWLKTDQREGKKKPMTSATESVRRGCLKAIKRLRKERWSLAIHRKCGTTWMALFFLASLAAITSVAIGLFMALKPTTLLIIGGVLVGLLGIGARPLGYLLQRTITVEVDFRRATVKRIIRRVQERGSVCYYVHLDVELEGDVACPTAAAR